MNITDIDWRNTLNTWSRADILYLRSICDEKLVQMDAETVRRRAIVRGEG